MTNQPIWPKPGDRVIFVGVPQFYFPQFTCMKKFCDLNLIAGEEYIIHKVQINSSWATVYIVGFEQDMLNWTFFKYAP